MSGVASTPSWRLAAGEAAQGAGEWREPWNGAGVRGGQSARARLLDTQACLRVEWARVGR